MTPYYDRAKIASNPSHAASGNTAAHPFKFEYQPRNPTVNDTNYQTQKVWLNTITNEFWALKEFNTKGTGGVVHAVWVPLAGDDIYLEKFTVDHNNSTISPDSSGNLKILGTQLPARTSTSAIQTDCMFPHTLFIGIQHSSVSNSSAPQDNGISHFNKSHFNIDSNGFVSLKNPTSLSEVKTIVFSNPGNFVYVPNPKMLCCSVVCIGGGGGGGGTTKTPNNLVAAASGGGAGEYAFGIFSAHEIGASQTVSVGYGGNGAVRYNAGEAGSDTCLGSLMTATGGNCGFPDQATDISISPYRSSDYIGEGGMYRIPGRIAAPSHCFYISEDKFFCIGGAGADSQLGCGGQGNRATPTFLGGHGFNAQGYGAGGGGAAAGPGQPFFDGGDGSSGIIIITEYVNY